MTQPLPARRHTVVCTPMADMVAKHSHESAVDLGWHILVKMGSRHTMTVNKHAYDTLHKIIHDIQHKTIIPPHHSTATCMGNNSCECHMVSDWRCRR